MDLILPDFTALDGRLDQIEAMVLTHAHEDHIGAVPYLLRERGDIPLIGSRLTLGLVRGKLTEHRMTPAVVEVAEGERLSFGPFDCEFFAVNHSIPDALAVAINPGRGSAAYRRLQDGSAPAGRPAHRPGRLRPARRRGRGPADVRFHQRRGARLRHLRAGHRSGPERDVRQHQPADHRGLLRLATCTGSSRCSTRRRRTGRKVAFVGRSMVRNMGVARDLGYLRVPGGLLVDLREAEEMPPGDVVLISTGSQGEPMSALSRMAGPGPPDQDRRRGHRDPGLVARPRQRDRGVPGDQRADPARAPAWCTRTTRWSTCLGTPRPASCCTC